MNYSELCEKQIMKNTAEEKKPSLLLHVCCAPCSSYVLEYLAEHFSITLCFYNPNIAPKKEYDFRLKELMRLLMELPQGRGVDIMETPYDPESFIQMAKGLEKEPEGGVRCKKCYELRLRKTAELAAAKGFDFFTTSLSISPYKNAEWLNTIGDEVGKKYGVAYLFSDFKKKNGYKRSIELSHEYGLYRQDYCGCAYSKAESLARRLEKNEI